MSEYEGHLRQLQENVSKITAGRKCAVREGPALLQGLALCGVCGKRMTVRYHTRRGKLLSPDYICTGVQERYGRRWCQNVPGQAVDDLIGTLLLQRMQPAALEVALAVQDELQARIDEADRLRYRRVEQAEYEMQCARSRYMAVDPHNRLVADELETDWNRTIREYRQAQEQYQQMREQDRLELSEEQRHKVLALCGNFGRLWQSPQTADRDRKRMLRLLIEDVTLTKGEELLVQVRYKGGALEEHRLPLPQSAWEERKHSPEVIAAIDALLDEHTDREVAEILNARGLSSGTGKGFDARRVAVTRRAYRIPSRYYRLEKRGLLTIHQICERYGLNRWAVYKLRNSGQIKAVRYDDVGRYLYDAGSLDHTMSRRGAV